MKDLFLTESDYADMGLGYEAGIALQTWVLERVGFVFSKQATCGSGTFVITSDGERAMLTARHVIIPAILRGEVQIAAYDGGRARSKIAQAITFSATSDTALVHASDDLVVPVLLSAPEWAPETAPDVDVDAHVIAGGLPRDWKGEIDLDTRVVAASRVMILWSQTTRVGQREIDTFARYGLPPTLRGMSGGPLFSFSRALLGIHQKEARHRDTDELLSLRSTRRTTWADLYRMTDTVLGPSDLEGCPLDWEQNATYKGVPVRIRFGGWFFVSPSEPSHPRGRFGRIDQMWILNSEETRRYPVNILSNFFLEEEDSTTERTQAFRTHVRELLDDMGFDPQ